MKVYIEHLTYLRHIYDINMYTVEHTYDACPKYSELGSFRSIAYLYVSDGSDSWQHQSTEKSTAFLYIAKRNHTLCTLYINRRVNCVFYSIQKTLLALDSPIGRPQIFMYPRQKRSSKIITIYFNNVTLILVTLHTFWATFLWSLTSLGFDWALFKTINVDQHGGKTNLNGFNVYLR